MENPGILHWRGWTFVRKAQVVGAAAGALIAISMPLVVNAYDGGSLAFLLLWLEWEIFSPAAVICRLFGWEWQGSSGPSWVQTTLAALANAFLLSSIGTLIGWLFRLAGIQNSEGRHLRGSPTVGSNGYAELKSSNTLMRR